MKKIQILFLILTFALIITACDLKLTLDPVEDDAKPLVFKQDNEQVDNENDDVQEQIIERVFNVVANEEKMALRIESNEEILYDDVSEICQSEVEFYLQPEALAMIIFKPFDPGSNKPVHKLYQFDLDAGTCQEMEVSNTLNDFGELVASPDKTKIAVALETDEARELKLLDLVNDKVISLVTLSQGETLNAGYGAMLNHFDFKWLNNQKIQYTVYENTVDNYDLKAPSEIEKVIEVRIISIEE